MTPLASVLFVIVCLLVPTTAALAAHLGRILRQLHKLRGLDLYARDPKTGRICHRVRLPK